MYAPFFGFTRLPFDHKLNADQLFRAPALDERLPIRSVLCV